MKIRTDFVTNSSSSSFVSISITSPKLASLINEYQSLFLSEWDENCCTIDLEHGTIDMHQEECYFDLPRSKDKLLCPLIAFLVGECENCCCDNCDVCDGDECATYPCACEYSCIDGMGFYGNKDEEMVREFLSKLQPNMKEYVDDIAHFEMRSCDVGWGGDSDSRFYRESYDEETLAELLDFIAEEKGCDVEDVTDDDFTEYVCDMCSIAEHHYVFDKEAGISEYSDDFYVE